ncbi:MAG: sigma-70 family RNA polymerase sigma factor [Acidobacteria bacterium]|nr:sigma-70 family RNA polymerase sigma factor [Acidobacteriota bacterium]
MSGKDKMPEMPMGEGMPSLELRQLITACAEGSDGRQWEEFVRRVHPVIASVVLRATRRFSQTSRDVVEDLVQETFVRLCADRCRVLRNFQATEGEAIFALVRTIAFNTTMDFFRGELAQKRGAGQLEIPLDVYAESAIPDHAETGHADREMLLEEIDNRLVHSGVRPQDRRIFWLHYRHGITSRAIAALTGGEFTPKGVESVIRRMTQDIRQWASGKRAPAAENEKKFEGKQPASPI